MLTEAPLRPQYEAVIIGAGCQGAALAYHLAREGLRDIAVLDRSYLGSGATGRNAGSIRNTYGSAEWIRFFDASTRLWHGLADELGADVSFSPRGHLLLALRDDTLELFRRCVALQNSLGVHSRLIDGAEVRAMEPAITPAVRGAIFEPAGGMVKHDVALWAYAAAAHRRGVEIHSHTEVTGITVERGRVSAVQTSRGETRTARVIDAAGAHGAAVARMAGIELPVTVHSFEKLVTEAFPPTVHRVVVSRDTKVSLSQTARGEFVFGSTETSPPVGLRSTYDFAAASARKILEIFPGFADVGVLRQWTGLIDMTPDHAPLLGAVDQVEGFFLDCGWGGHGLTGAPAGGALLARLILHGERSPLIEPFDVGRVAAGRLVGDSLLTVREPGKDPHVVASR